MPSKTNEESLEALIEAHLTGPQAGYTTAYPTDYDRELCLMPRSVWAFIERTQPETYATLQRRGPAKFIKRLADQVKQRGVIDVLRKGVKDLELTVYLYYKQPASNLNATATANYEANNFGVSRQLHYSLANQNSLDLALFINGLPVATFELKNPWTGQTVKNAIRQYQQDRDPREPLFAFGRCVVHFAVDPELVYMTTHLRGKDTTFLPFNKGDGDGAGNPVNPHGLKTAYLWEEILPKDRLANIIENYAQQITETDEDTGKQKKKLIFPRYHQLRVVDKCLRHAQAHGTGQRYLIQHSAGSGKSNSITWLSHQLANLHDASHTDTVFDSVIVVTDRRVLDKQIRDNIKQFGQVEGVVEAITQGSQQLKQALLDRKKIIITTIQKFPHICDEIGTLTGHRFALLIDEAHSSTSGETAAKMNATLAQPQDDDDEREYTTEDLVNEAIENRKLLKNASYFAFTATPKNKTLELFGQETPDGRFKPFDLYSMKQAIEEEFILDVLKNYSTYRSFYKLNKSVEDNPLFETRQAQRQLREYAESHPYSIKEKAKIMLDHFEGHTRKRINGQAKTMVVCKSIKSAIRYFFAFKELLRERDSPYKAIVAFSGKKDLDGQEYDEASLNGFSGNDIPTVFKRSEYRFLIVAEKFQTGFDQPLLHTMYVDKKLSDVQAVQTLSRLNRALKPDKVDTFVLDFFNEVEHIQEAFEDYYTTTILSEATDANKLNDLQTALDEAQVYTLDDVTNFTDLYFNNADRSELEPILDVRAAYFRESLSEDEQIHFYVKAKSFGRTYAFLSKVLTFNNPYWERVYWFLKYLMPKIAPAQEEAIDQGILEAIELDSYRLSRTTSQDISLTGGQELDPSPPTTRGSRSEAELEGLEAIVNDFNTRFGVDKWSDDDKLKTFLFEQLPKDIANDARTQSAMRVAFDTNDQQNARITSDQKVEQMMQEVIFEYTDLYKKFTDDPDFKRQYQDFIFNKLWQQTGSTGAGR